MKFCQYIFTLYRHTILLSYGLLPLRNQMVSAFQRAPAQNQYCDVEVKSRCSIEGLGTRKSREITTISQLRKGISRFKKKNCGSTTQYIVFYLSTVQCTFFFGGTVFESYVQHYWLVFNFSGQNFADSKQPVSPNI